MSVHGEFDRYRRGLRDCVQVGETLADEASRWREALEAAEQGEDQPLEEAAGRVLTLLESPPPPPASIPDPEAFADQRDRLEKIARIILGR